MAAKTIKVDEIARRINDHLKRFEADPAINAVLQGALKTRPYFNVSAWGTGRFVKVRYISYQHDSTLSKADALVYLEWLDAGNVGKHWEILGR